MKNVNKAYMKNPFYQNFNFNPWKQRIGDCAIRSISIAINMSYTAVCKALHVKCKNGYGLVRDTGIDLEDIKSTFDRYFDNVTDFGEDFPKDAEMRKKDAAMTKFDLEQGIDSFSSGQTVNGFIKQYKGAGRFLVGCISPKKKSGHIVYVNTDQQYFIDIFDCGDFIVDAWMKIKTTVSIDDPRRLKLAADRRTILP